jgi:tetratricopeptide (TPR) repeat protein
MALAILALILAAPSWGTALPPFATPAQNHTSACSQGSLQSAFMEGQQALIKGDLETAQDCFRRVVSRDPNNAGAHANLGVIAMRRKQWQLALSELKAAERLAPAVSGIRLNIGLVYYRQGDYRAAIAPLKSVVHDQQQGVQARFLLGLSYFLAGDYPNALDALEPLWSQESTNLSYLYVLGVAADETRDSALENRAAARLVEVGGNSPQVHLLVGKADLARVANEQALRELETAARTDPRLPFVHFYLGVAYRRLHNFARAREEFQQDLGIDPDIAYTYDELGAVCTYLERNQDAEKYYREALRLDPHLASSYYGLASIEAREKRYRSALVALTRAGQLDPTSASVHYLRGRVLMQLGRKTAAQSEFQIAGRMQRRVRDKLQREISGTSLPNPELGAQ